jgi:hypothetical protein
MSKTKIYFVIFIFLTCIVYLSYFIGAINQRIQTYDLCMQYHAGLLKEDADFTCKNIMKGDRHAFIEKHEKEF